MKNNLFQLLKQYKIKHLKMKTKAKAKHFTLLETGQSHTDYLNLVKTFF